MQPTKSGRFYGKLMGMASKVSHLNIYRTQISLLVLL